MFITLLYIIISLFCGAQGMALDSTDLSKKSDEAWEKWAKEEPVPLLEQWTKSNQVIPAKKPEAKSELSDTVCGSVPAEEHFSPNKYIARLNGAQMIHDYPARCKDHYMNMMVDIIATFIEDLNAQNLLDIEIMIQEILALRTEKNKEGIDKVLEKIKNLKEKDGGI